MLSAIPRATVLRGSAAAAALLAISAPWSASAFTSLATLLALALLAGSAASVLDEHAAGIVDATPRTLRWRTTVRLVAMVVPSAVWCGGVALRTLRSADPAPLALLPAGLVVLTVAVTAAAVLRRLGHTTPSELAAPLTGALVIGLGLFHPMSRWVSVIPVDAASSAQRMVWTVLITACATALLISTRDPYRWRQFS
jgi:hypothetical protein